MKHYRILFISTGLDYGGAETQLVHISIKLKLRGWKVKIVSLKPPLAYMDKLEEADIPVSSLGVRWKIPDPRLILHLLRLIREWRPHIVHSYMVHANLLTRIVRPLAPIPVLICSARNVNEGGRLRELLYRITDPLCDLTTQVSRVGLDRYVRIGAVPRHKIRYIPNGVDTERFKPVQKLRATKRKELLLNDDYFCWLAVGRFHPQKDYTCMLRSFAEVAKARPDVLLIIAGDGPLRPEMEKLASALGIAEQVRFLGVRQDVPELMNAADAYVMSSAWEGMPNVLLEASATGLPIVATNVGGNSEIVLDGKTGFLVPPKDPSALAQAMLRLMDLPKEERQKMGQAGREHVLVNFSLERVVDMWESLYTELIAKKGIRV